MGSLCWLTGSYSGWQVARECGFAYSENRFVRSGLLRQVVNRAWRGDNRAAASFLGA